MNKKEKYQQLERFLKTGEVGQLFQLGLGELKELMKDPTKPETWSDNELAYLAQVRLVNQAITDRFGNDPSVIKELHRSLLSSYFTPDAIVKAIVSSIPSGGISKIMEPSAGSGNFITPLRSVFPEAKITAVEKEAITYASLLNNHPDVRCIHSGVEDLNKEQSTDFDLVISNIPFGDFSVYDASYYASRDAVKINSTTRIHNYFFLKGLDMLSQKGVMVYITSSAFADSKSNEKFRERLMNESSLLAHMRLPDSVFTQTGTKASTDIVIVQKKEGKQPLTEWEKAFVTASEIELSTGTETGKAVVNDALRLGYSKTLGQLRLGGQYGNKNAICFSADPLDRIAEQINSYLVERFAGVEPVRGKARVSHEQEPALQAEGNDAVLIPASDKTKNLVTGNLFVYQQKAGRVTVDGERIEFEQLKALPVERVANLVALRETYKKLVKTETETGQESAELRSSLNDIYNAYSFTYGHLNTKDNRKLLDFDAEDFKLLSLEVARDGEFKKADIFRFSTLIEKEKEVRPISTFEALLLSYRKVNQVDVELMASMLEQPVASVVNRALDEELIFIDSDQNLGYRFVAKDEFLSGDILEKLDWLENHFPFEYEERKFKHKEALQGVCPAVLPIEIIDINLGERWLPEQLYNDFVSDYFQEPAKVVYLPALDQYTIDISGGGEIDVISEAINSDSGRYAGHKLMENAFMDTAPVFTKGTGQFDENGKEIRTTDEETTRLAADKIEAMKESFDKWLKGSEKWKTVVEETYHRKFNSKVARVYDGRYFEPVGLNFFKPHDYQARGGHMILQLGGGIADHKVGAGKSLLIAMGAMESRRLGLSKKPLAICLKVNVAGIYDDFKKAYPQAKVLFPTEKDFEPKNRKILFSKMMNNDWDCVIITHEQYKMIPQSREIQMDIINKELDALEQDLRIMTENGVTSKRLEKGLVTRQNNLETRLKVLESNIARDPNITDFAKMGFDLMFVDESQQFKNLMYTTRHTQVSGLGDPKGSGRAYNLLTGIRTIQAKHGKDKGVVFLSGTVISNSLVELYLLFKYLRPTELEKLNINSFDAWAKVYAKKSTDYEFSITNEVKRKERYREFIKVPELTRFYREITDVVTSATMKIDVPKVENIVVPIPPTPNQQDFIQRLISFCKTKDGTYIGRGYLSDNEKKAFMLLATNAAKKMSLDMRVLDDSYPFESGCKLDVCAGNIAEHYKESNHFKGTQLVFCDISTPGSGTDSTFSAYQELARLLVVKHGLKPGEIAFIHDASTRPQRNALFKKVNDGTVRVMIGSTVKMGTGVNVQKRVVAMHHLDIPWRPSDLEQRDGRGGRQGNIFAKKFMGNVVKSYVYATEKSLDSYQFNLLANKQKFIQQMKTGDVKQRRMDEGSMGGEGAEQSMNFAEFVAELSGNKRLLERVKLDKKIRDLEGQYQAVVGEAHYAARMVENLKASVKHDQKTVEVLKADLALYHAMIANPDKVSTPEKRYYYPKPVLFDGKPFYDVKLVGEELLGRVEKIAFKHRASNQTIFKDSSPVELATYGPFKLYYDWGVSGAYMVSSSGRVYKYNDGQVNDNPSIGGAFIKNALERIETIIGYHSESILRDQKRIEPYQRKAAVVFDRTDDLEAMRKELKGIDRELEAANTEESKLVNPDKKLVTIEAEKEGLASKNQNSRGFI